MEFNEFNRPASMAYQPYQKGPDPLSDNWTYDSAIDLFSLNTMMSDPFALDIPDDIMNFDPRDLLVDTYAPPPGISGFTISNSAGEDMSGSSSSDPESDDHDQLWSPTHPVDSQDLPAPAQSERRKPITRKRQPTRYSSSPEITPQGCLEQPQPTQPRKMTRSLSGDSTGSGSAPNNRNAAKRAAHNIIEKRYRTNMNAKFVALEKAMSGNGVHKPTSKNGSASLKKSEILSNAIAYMEELQEENKMMRKEMALLKQNLLPAGIWRHKQETFG